MSAILLKFIPILLVLLIIVLNAIWRPLFYIPLVLIWLAISASAWFQNINPQFYLLGLNIYIPDLFIIANILGLLAFNKSTTNWLSCLSTRMGIALLAITIIGVFSWVQVSGLKAGVNHWREYLFDYSFFLYCIKSPVTWAKREIQFVALLPAILLAVLTIIKISISGFGRTDGVDPLTGLSTGRPTTAEGAFMLLIALVICLYLSGDNKFLKLVLLPFFASLVLVLQHRSVWTSAIMVAVLWFFLEPNRTSGLKRTSKFVVLSFIGALTYVITNSTTNFTAAASNNVTFQWRLDRWKESFAISRSATQWLFGASFGPTPVSGGGGLLSVFAHDALVNAIENIGYVGSFLMILLLVSPLFGKARLHSEMDSVQVTLILASITYGVTYGFPRPSFGLLGIFVAYNIQRRNLMVDSNLTTAMKSGSKIP